MEQSPNPAENLTRPVIKKLTGALLNWQAGYTELAADQEQQAFAKLMANFKDGRLSLDRPGLVAILDNALDAASWELINQQDFNSLPLKPTPLLGQLAAKLPELDTYFSPQPPNEDDWAGILTD